MNCTVYLIKVDSSFQVIIKRVRSIELSENVYFHYDDEDNILLTAPIETVIAIERM